MIYLNFGKLTYKGWKNTFDPQSFTQFNYFKFFPVYMHT